ncbi:Os10g0361876, partial [Oryza sativa Japonica Group]
SQPLSCSGLVGTRPRPRELRSAHSAPPPRDLVADSGCCGANITETSRHRYRLITTTKTPQESPRFMHRGWRSTSSSPTPAAELHLRFLPLR